MAVNNLGPLALPLGQAIGRNVGRVLGGAAGAAAIRCPARSRSGRSSSSVRFSPNIQFRSQPLSVSATQNGEIQGDNQSSHDLFLAVRQQHAGLAATQQMVSSLSGTISQSDKKFDQLQDMMQNMAQMVTSAQQNSIDRENALRGEITTAISRSDKTTESLSAQVTHLTSTVQVLREQLNTNSDFSVDALQQIRSEFRAEIEASKSNAASNAGGNMPGSATDTALVNNVGKPLVTTSADIDSYAIQCSYCLGSVPRVITEHCKDCDLFFHPGHYQPHRDEWPCP